MLNCVLVPNDHKAITVQISTRHFVLFRSISFGWKDNNVDKIAQLFEPSVTLPDALEQSDVTRMTAGILGNSNRSLNGLLGKLRSCTKHLLIVSLLLALFLAEVFSHFVDCKALALDAHKYFSFIEQALLINDANEYR